MTRWAGMLQRHRPRAYAEPIAGAYVSAMSGRKKEAVVDRQRNVSVAPAPTRPVLLRRPLHLPRGARPRMFAPRARPPRVRREHPGINRAPDLDGQPASSVPGPMGAAACRASRRVPGEGRASAGASGDRSPGADARQRRCPVGFPMGPGGARTASRTAPGRPRARHRGVATRAPAARFPRRERRPHARARLVLRGALSLDRAPHRARAPTGHSAATSERAAPTRDGCGEPRCRRCLPCACAYRGAWDARTTGLAERVRSAVSSGGNRNHQL